MPETRAELQFTVEEIEAPGARLGQAGEDWVKACCYGSCC